MKYDFLLCMTDQKAQQSLNSYFFKDWVGNARYTVCRLRAQGYRAIVGMGGQPFPTLLPESLQPHPYLTASSMDAHPSAPLYRLSIKYWKRSTSCKRSQVVLSQMKTLGCLERGWTNSALLISGSHTQTPQPPP